MSFAGYYFEFWSIKCDISYYAYFEEIDGNMLFGLATSIKKNELPLSSSQCQRSMKLICAKY